MDKVDELLLVAKYGNDASVREAAGMEAVEIYTAEGMYWNLIEMSENNELLEKVREEAGMKAIELCAAKVAKYIDDVSAREAAGMEGVKIYTAKAKAKSQLYYFFVKMSENNELPEKVREEAGMKAIELCAAEVVKDQDWAGYLFVKMLEGNIPKEMIASQVNMWYLLVEMSENNKLPEKVREEAGMKAIEKYVNNDWDSDYNLNAISKNNKLPDEVRKAAKNALQKIRKQREVRKQREEHGLRLVQTQTLSPPRHKNEIDELLLIARYGNDASVREAAGMKIIERYTAEDEYDRLIEMLKDNELPEKVREAAGMKIIEIYTAKGYYDDLIRMSKNNDLPEKVKEAAKNNIEAAGMKAIEEYTANCRYGRLIELSKNNELPEKVREAAKNNIEVVEMKIIKVIEEYTANGYYDNLIEMSKDNNLPKKVREAAGMKAIKKYTARDWYDDLIEMSKNNDLPEKVREAAKNALQKIAEQLAEEYNLKPANPLQGDGLAVEPTREFLKGKKDKEPQKKPTLKNTK